MLDKNTTNGARLIEQERLRQKAVEKYSDDHDDEHDDGELAQAANCYFELGNGSYGPSELDADQSDAEMPDGWPWDEEWWKPKTRLSNLVRAGALYQAEIDRLKRRARRVIELIDADQAQGPQVLSETRHAAAAPLAAPVGHADERDTFAAKHFTFGPCFHSMVKPDCPSCCQSHAVRMEMQLGKLEGSTALPVRGRIEKAVREQMRHCYQVYKGVPPTVEDWVGGALHYVMWGIERDLPLPAAPVHDDAEELARQIVGTVFDNTGASHETLKQTMIERITDAIVVGHISLPAPTLDAARRAAEEAFLAASVAVWQEIDRLSESPEGYKGLDASTELRKRERAAWENYKADIAATPADNDAEGGC